MEKTETVEVSGVELSMTALGDLSDGAAAELALTPLVTGYRAWIDEQDAALTDLTGERRTTAEELVFHARSAADRIERGIGVLSQDADALDAFRVANRAVAAALSRRLAREGVTEPPRWRAFQLAFLLLNLSGLADPANPEREFVDLLFFPTGGGKTEAYLGLAAFTMVLRRLRNPEDAGRAGAGVSVIMRYTLRLLTLDQLGRAAGLVCALELERRKDAGRYGDWPFEIGLWVGKAGTPNRLGERGDNRSDSARSKVSQYKNNPQGRPAPIPIEGCPWCGEEFTPDSFALLPDADHPTELRIACANWECDFSGDTPLPIVAVDEPLYRRLPAFLVATVDKFASLPWVGESGALLGGADRHDEYGFYGAAEPRSRRRIDLLVYRRFGDAFVALEWAHGGEPPAPVAGGDDPGSSQYREITIRHREHIRKEEPLPRAAYDNLSEHGRSRRRVTEDEFLESCDEFGKEVFASILDLARRESMPIHWGSKRFSVGVTVHGTRVVVCYANPPTSHYKQSLYTALRDRAGIQRKAGASGEVIDRLWQSAEVTGLFKPAGRELKCVIDRKFATHEVDPLIAWCESVEQAIVGQGQAKAPHIGR